MNIPGWKTMRKLIILESDDWGSIRMPSRQVYEKLLKTGDRVDRDPFTRYDSLESEDDLSQLFDVLKGFRDWKGNHPVITANCAVANPDFDKIKESGYREFYYEPFTETFKKYPRRGRSFGLWQQGMKENIFLPQLHCREHMNINRWLKHLQEERSDVLRAFENSMISTGNSFAPENKYAYMDAFNYDSEEELAMLKNSLKEGAELFEAILGYASKSFIAPCYIWDSILERELLNVGVEYIQGDRIQLIPKKAEGTKSLGRKSHYTGQINRYNQIYLIRNCFFEPSWNKYTDWIDCCMKQIETAYKWKKPAVISSHRLNYTGCIDKSSRDKNLKLLSSLLSQIIKTWPDVEFITSVELGDTIRRDRNNINI